ncbi:tetratricopeptide repeat protein [Micromonospora vinacea]|uniref:ATP-binding protein n=1 Tax=Micromonospora vinacea TaxID=709878 RepID=UPI003453C1A4
MIEGVIVKLPIPRQLPSPPHHFTGRNADLVVLDKVLAENDAVEGSRAVLVSAVSGTPGIGKTGLALHWAHSVRERFPDGDLYVDLRGHAHGAPVSRDEALDGFLQAFELPTEGVRRSTEQKAALLRSVLADRRILLVLDNAADLDQIRLLLPGSSRCLVIVTSRNRLPGLAEHASVTALSLDPLPDAEARELLRRVSGYRDDDLPALNRVLRYCGGLPLAIRILGSRLASPIPGRRRVLLSSLETELAVERDRLDGFELDDGSRAVRTVFSWSYRRLSPSQAEAFRSLGLHPGPSFGSSVAATMLELPSARAARILRFLCSTSLLEETGAGRYKMHDLLRIYAQDLAEADQSGQRAVLERLCCWYLRCASAVDRLLAPSRRPVPDAGLPAVIDLPSIKDRASALEWAAEERDCLIGVTRTAARAGLAAWAWRLPAMAFSYFNLKKTWAVWVETHLIGLRAAQEADDLDGQAWILNCLGIAYYDQQRMDIAIACYEQALAIRRLRGDAYGIGATLLNLGAVCWAQGRNGMAIGYYVQALHRFQRIGERWGEAMILNNLSAAYRDLCELDAAVAHARQALLLWRQLGDARGEGMTLNLLGEHHAARGDDTEALEQFAAALQVRRRIADDWGTAMTLKSMAAVQIRIGQHEAGRRSLTEALVVLESLTDPATDLVRAELAALDHSADDDFAERGRRDAS